MSSDPFRNLPPAQSETGDPFLLTPGPLTTSNTVKEAMLHDWGSRDAAFVAINARCWSGCRRSSTAKTRIVTVPMQGSGTFAVEAMLTTFVPRDGETLVLINGAYGQRAKRILDDRRPQASCYETPEDTPPDPARSSAFSQRRPRSPMSSSSTARRRAAFSIRSRRSPKWCARHGKRLLIDAMSAFGALPLDAREDSLRRRRGLGEQVPRGRAGPGLRRLPPRGARRDAGNATTLVARPLRPVPEFREDRPVPLHAADPRHRRLPSGARGIRRRGRRRRPRRALPRQCRILVEGMRALGFRTLLPDALQAPIIVTFHMPTHPSFVFQRFYDALKARGYVIYPGKLTVADSFRIGCIGRLYADEMRAALDAVREVLARWASSRSTAPRVKEAPMDAHGTQRHGQRPRLSLADSADRRHLPRRLGARLYRKGDRRASPAISPDSARRREPARRCRSSRASPIPTTCRSSPARRRACMASAATISSTAPPTRK